MQASIWQLSDSQAGSQIIPTAPDFAVSLIAVPISGRFRESSKSGLALAGVVCLKHLLR